MTTGEPDRVPVAPVATGASVATDAPDSPDARGAAAADGGRERGRALAARIPIVASVAYVAAVAIRAEHGRGGRAWALAAPGLALVLATRSARAAREGARARALVLWGAAVTASSLGASGPSAWSDALGAAGAAGAAIGACLAASALAAPVGLLVPRGARAIPLATLTAAWGVALVASTGHALGEPWLLADHAAAAALAASFASLLAVGGAVVASAHARRLELGIPTRANAALALSGATTLACAAAVLAGAGATVRIARVGVVVIAYVVTWIALHRDAAVIARAARRALVLILPGGSVALIGVMLAHERASSPATVVALATAAAIAIGVASPALARPLRPLHGAWLDAVEAAHAALAKLDPEDAIRNALAALRAPAGPSGASPELWTIDPPRVYVVDAAGYGREREAALPAGLVACVAAEPEATLRREVLEALAVRRPDLRVFASWMEDRGALTATVVTRSGEPEGLLVLPHGTRTEALTLEEARAIRGLADTFASICSARAMLARSLDREQVTRTRAEKLADEAERLRHEHDLEIGRHLHLAARLARPASLGVYSALARMAYDAIERRVSAAGPLALVAPAGVDPVPFLARAHIDGPRRRGPFVVVDGTSTAERELALWTTPGTSPLALADRGMLVLLDGAALPAEVQQLVARALAEKRVPWDRAEPLDVQLVLTAADAPDALVDAGRLEGSLATRLADARHQPIELPRLRDRPEDLRAIVTDRLAREGLRAKGRPVGIDSPAFARLVEHVFAGESAELDAIVLRLVAACEGDVVRARDVEAIGL